MRIAVIGGGPAGSAFATFATRRGFDVAIFDDGNRPDLIVGESNIPAVVPILQRLGIEEKVAAFSLRKPGASFVPFPEDAINFTFEAVRGHLPTYSYNIPRPKFDDILATTARDSGATVIRQRARLLASGDHVELAPDSLAAVPHWQNGQPDLIIDATGRRRELARLLKIPAQLGPRKDVSHFAHYEGFARECPRGQIAAIHLDHGWAWRIPLPDRTSFGIVLDSRHAAALGDTPEERLDHVLRHDPALADEARHAHRVTPVQTYANYQLISERGVGGNWAAIGDAFGFVDPMLSPGMITALGSAEKLADLLAEKKAARALPAYSTWMRHHLTCWMQFIEYFYSGRIFAMHETGANWRAAHPNRVTSLIDAHIATHLACMASGAFTTRPYSRQLLRAVGHLATARSDPKKFAIR